MKRLGLIMCGVSGSGKSTLATMLKQYIEQVTAPAVREPGMRAHEDVTIASADEYFELHGGYNKDLIEKAHIYSWTCALAGFDWNSPHSTDHVIVDNTNLKAHEISPYMLMGKAFGARMVVIRVHTGDRPFKSIHNVPEDNIRWQMQDFNKRDVLRRWEVVDINQAGLGLEAMLAETVRKLRI